MKSNIYPYYAIRTSGSRDNIFTIRKVVAAGATNPVDCIAYMSQAKAQEAADQMGIKIEKIGSCYEIA